MKRFVLSVLVENHAGVLSRVSGLFSRRGYNIDSLTVGVTSHPGQSRMTIVVQGDDHTLDQIEKQLFKLEEVITIEHCDPSETVLRETALIKVSAPPEARVGIIETANIFRAHVVDVGIETLVIEATGSQDKIASLIRLLEPFGIKDLGYFLASLGFVLLGYLFIAALISFLSVSMKNVGLTIVSYAAISMVFTIVASLLQIGILILESNGNSTVLPILEFFQNINLFNSLGTVIGQGHTYTLENILYLVLSSVIGIVFYGGFGLLIINKKEIK